MELTPPALGPPVLAPGPGPEGALVEVGERLRLLRRARRASLSEVAKATGLSQSFLSLVENGRSDISLGRLTRLIDFYGISIVDLTADADAGTADARVVRQDERRTLTTAEGVRTEVLASAISAGVVRLIMTLEPGCIIDIDDQALASAAESFYLVLEGELLVELSRGELVILRPGDSMSLQDRDFRRSRNIVRGETVVFVERVWAGAGEAVPPAPGSGEA